MPTHHIWVDGEHHTVTVWSPRFGILGAVVVGVLFVFSTAAVVFVWFTTPHQQPVVDSRPDVVVGMFANASMMFQQAPLVFILIGAATVLMVGGLELLRRL
jgi:hypothetical protein